MHDVQVSDMLASHQLLSSSPDDLRALQMFFFLVLKNFTSLSPSWSCLNNWRSHVPNSIQFLGHCYSGPILANITNKHSLCWLTNIVDKCTTPKRATTLLKRLKVNRSHSKSNKLIGLVDYQGYGAWLFESYGHPLIITATTCRKHKTVDIGFRTACPILHSKILMDDLSMWSVINHPSSTMTC